MPFGQELFDPTDSEMLPDPVQRDVISTGGPPTVSSGTNVRRFNAAFGRMLPGYVSPGYVINRMQWDESIQGGILYLPKGRYLVENVINTVYGWHGDGLEGNLWERYMRGEALVQILNDVRGGNPFGASLQFPKEITLWLAPGAVLVPAEGAIVHIASALVCDPVQIFDLSFGGLVVFGERVPRLLPEWWMGPDGDVARAIQDAIDAGLHHRSNRWEATSSNGGERDPRRYLITEHRLPPIPVALRGRYDVGRTVEVRGGTTNTRLLHILGERAVKRGPARLDFPGERVVRWAPQREVVLQARRYRRNDLGQLVGANGRAVDADGRPITAGVEEPIDTASVQLDPANNFTTASIDVAEAGESTLISVTFFGVVDNELPRTSSNITRLEIRPATLDLTGTTTIGLTWADGTRSTIVVHVENPARKRREVPIHANLTIAGAWQGRSRQGAQLVPTSTFEGAAIVRFVYTAGLTLRDISLDARPRPGLGCLEVLPVPGVGAQSFHGMAILQCAFYSTEATLVQLGTPLEYVPASELAPDSLPAVYASNFGSDMSAIAFERCDFRPKVGGTAVAVRTSQSVPFRFHGCSFAGEANAMITAWSGTFLVDHCSFENMRVPPEKVMGMPGFEVPDGVDLHLRFEPPVVDPGRTRPRTATLSGISTPAAFTAIGCVSKSATFLSTPSNLVGIAQFTTWPVVLLNVRHVPSSTGTAVRSIQWHLKPKSVPLVQPMGLLARSRLGAVPLAVVGGQFGGGLTTSHGSSPCVVVGARDLGDGAMRIEVLPPPMGVRGYFETFVLPIDQRRR